MELGDASYDDVDRALATVMGDYDLDADSDTLMNDSDSESDSFDDEDVSMERDTR